MASICKLPSGSFRAQIRRKGLAILPKTFKTRDEAEAWAIATEAGLLVTHNLALPKLSENSTFRGVADRYFNSPTFANKAGTTQTREKTNSKRILEYFGSYAISVIDSMLVQEYLDIRSREFAKKGNGKNKAELVSGDAVRLDKALLGSIFKFAKIRKLVPVNIMRDTFETPTCNAKEARISFKQQNDLFRVAKEYALKKTTNKCLLSWLYFVFETGTRPGEAAKAELSWFDLKARKVSIPRAGQKKRNPRIVIIRQELADVLKERMQVAVEAGSKYMFWSRKKERLAKDEDGAPVRRRRTASETAAREMTPFAYYPPWRAICKLAHIPTDINPHIIRHEFISRLYECTELNDGQIAALVGDVNVLSLTRYRHLQVERLRGQQDAHLDEIAAVMTSMRERRLDTH